MTAAAAERLLHTKTKFSPFLPAIALATAGESDYKTTFRANTMYNHNLPAAIFIAVRTGILSLYNKNIMDWKDELRDLLEDSFGEMPSDILLYEIYKIISNHFIPESYKPALLKEFAFAALPGFITIHEPGWSSESFDRVTQTAFLQAQSMMNEYNKYLEKIKNPE